MFAWQPDGCGVRAFIPCLFREDHLVADVEMLEARIEHAVFVKVYLAAIRGLDEAVALPREELADFSVRRRVMRLYIVAQAAHVVLQLPPHRFESVANRHIHILVRTLDFEMLVALHFLLMF